MLKYNTGTGNATNWLIAETAFDPDHQGKCEAIFCQGNGYLGQRAAFEESYTGQTRDLLVTGTFNRFDDKEVCELPNLPDLTNLALTLNGHPFKMDRGACENYLRVMNLHTGEMTRALRWTDPDGNRYDLTFQRFVSLADEHLLGTRVMITPLDAPVSLTFRTGIDGTVTCTGSQHFHEGDKRVLDGKVLRMVSETTESRVICVQHSALTFSLNGEQASVRLVPVIDRRYLGFTGTLEVPRYAALTLDKLSTVTTSRDLALDGESAQEAQQRAEEDGMARLLSAMALGYDKAFLESAAAWKDYWDMHDIEIESENPFDQLMLRFAIYHLRIMDKPDDPRVGIGAKGLTGEGYKGHSFWDTEIFILPYFILTDPQAARSLLTFRYRGLLGARRKAAENGFEGAMYPWEAAWVSDGEVTPLWGGADIVTGKPIPILTGMIEQHITADVAFGVHLYDAVTHDQTFMDECGYEILIDTARFWASRVTRDERGYVILDVIGPDEYKEHVNNNAYTNYMAMMNLKLAVDAIEKLKARSDEVCARLDRKFHFDACLARFREVIGGMYLPKPGDDGIIPQFDGYFDLEQIDLTPYKTSEQIGTIYQDYNPEQMNRIQVHKQADTLVLLLLMDDLFPHDIKLRNYTYYEARTLHDSSLSKSTHCVLASDLGEKDVAYRFFEGCGDIDLGPKMNTSDMGIHTASMGGIWQCAVYGFGGVRVVGDGLRVCPALPDAWSRMAFPLVWRGQRLEIEITKQCVSVLNLGSETVVLHLAGREAAIAPGQGVTESL